MYCHDLLKTQKDIYIQFYLLMKEFFKEVVFTNVTVVTVIPHTPAQHTAPPHLCIA